VCTETTQGAIKI